MLIFLFRGIDAVTAIAVLLDSALAYFECLASDLQSVLWVQVGPLEQELLLWFTELLWLVVLRRSFPVFSFLL